MGPGKLGKDGAIKPMELSVGDRVLFSNFAGTEVKGMDEEVLIMSEDDVLAVIE